MQFSVLIFNFAYFVGLLFHVEAVSLTCDDTTDVCPGTELTCTCSVSNINDKLTWTLPGSQNIIAFDYKEGVGFNKTTDNGIFFAVITNNTGVLESMLIYTANESLVNATIECSGYAGAGAVSTMITVTLAG